MPFQRLEKPFEIDFEETIAKDFDMPDPVDGPSTRNVIVTS